MSLSIAIVGGGLNGKAMALAACRYIQEQELDCQLTLIDEGSLLQASAKAYGQDFWISSLEFSDSRTYSLTPASIEFLQSLVAADLRPFFQPAAQDQSASPFCFYQNIEVWDQASGSTIEFTADDIRLPYLGAMVEHRHMDALLNQSLLACDCELRGDTEVVALEYSDQLSQPAKNLQSGSLSTSKTAQITLTTNQHGKESQSSYHFVIACDGSQSPLRSMAGIGAQHLDYQQSALVFNAIVEHASPANEAKGFPYTRAKQVFAPTGPCAMLPLTPFENKDQLFNLVWSYDSYDVPRLQAMSDQEFLAELNHLFRDEAARFTSIGSRTAVPLRKVMADKMSARYVALVGDSAHLIHPLAGQGINLGFADARSLIDAFQSTQGFAQGLNREQVLSRYSRARSLKNKTTAATMDLFYRGFSSASPSVGYLRSKGLGIVDNSTALKKLFMSLATG